MNETSYEAIKTAQREHFDGVSDKYSEVVGEAAYYHYLQMTKDALFAELSSYFEDLSTLVGIDVGCGQGNLVAAVGARLRAEAEVGGARHEVVCGWRQDLHLLRGRRGQSGPAMPGL